MTQISICHKKSTTANKKREKDCFGYSEVMVSNNLEVDMNTKDIKPLSFSVLKREFLDKAEAP